MESKVANEVTQMTSTPWQESRRSTGPTAFRTQTLMSGKAMATAAFVIALTGTGSNFSINNHEYWNTLARNRGISLIEATTQSFNQISTVEMLQAIQGRFSLSTTEFAERLGITRQGFYKWLSGSEPGPGNVAKIKSLFNCAEKFNGLEFLKIHELVRVKVFSGKSLLDLVFTDQLLEGQIKALISEAPYLVGPSDEDSYAFDGSKYLGGAAGYLIASDSLARDERD